MAGRQVFICAAAEDAGYYSELITALNAWEVPHTEMGVVPNPVISMPPTIELEIRQCGVFLRVCTTHTRQSNAVKLATDYFQQLLQQDRSKGGRQRRRLVNLILDPAYPLDVEEKKTLYIMAPGKARALWLEELAVSVGAATLTQQLSRRALFGMGAGAAVAVASAGVAGTMLLKQFQSQQEPPLPVQAKISGNPRFSFRLSDSKASFGYARIFQDGATIYAQPALSDDSTTQPDSSVYVLSVGDRKQRRIPITIPADVPGTLMAAGSGSLALFCSESLGEMFRTLSTLRVMSAHDGKQLCSIECYSAETPVISDGVLYAMFGIVISRTAGELTIETSLNAYRVTGGPPLWRKADYDISGSAVPAVVGNRLYIGSTNNHVYCLDTKTGAILWQYLTRGPVLGTPTVVGGTLYVGSNDGAVYALDANSGKFYWRFATSGRVTVAPFIHDGIAYVASNDAYIYALDAQSGAMFWRAYAGVNPATDNLEIRWSVSTPTIYRNVLFATVYGGLYAFDTRTGAQRWRYIPVEESAGTISPPIVNGGLALVGAADNQVHAVNP